MKYTHIIWDWNGTLLNDIGASLASVNDMLALRGKPPIDADYYRECIGVPIVKFYEKVFELEKEDYNLIIKQYNDGYVRHLDKCSLTKGAVSAIKAFSELGLKQAVVSSSNSERIAQDMKKYGVSDMFDAVLGASDYLAGSKIDRALEYLKKEGAESSRVLVVGDLEHDAKMASQLGADCVLLTSGHEHISRLKACGVPLIDDLVELTELVKN